MPAMMLKTDPWYENAGKDKWLVTRDSKFRTIKRIITDNYLLECYIYGDSITHEIQAIRKDLNVKSAGGIYRDLNRYLTFGSTKNAILPIDWAKCGNRITWQDNEGNTIKRGRKTRKNRHGQLVECRSKTRGIEPQDKLNILKLLKEEEITNQTSYREFSKERLWNEFNKRYQSQFIIRSGPNGDDYYPWLFEEKDRISRGQFFDHVRNLLSDEQELRIKLGKVRFEKDKAVKTGLARDGIVGAGHCYAIDATILDVYVRYPYNPKIKSCGRPVLYLVVDVWSTCIVGYYLGFHGPDWTGAGEALYHACINKSEWAKRIGWDDFKEGSWNCHHVPARILGDNGAELSEINTLSVIGAEIGIEMFDYAPVFRGDAKSVVERKFGVLNKSFINFQPGYVYKEALRELPHAANDAVWDYRSLLIAIGREIVYHNNNANRLKRHNFSMSRAGIGITPQALYDYSMNHEMEGGSVEEDRARLRLAFLREESATVYGDCIKHNGLEYVFPNGEELGIYAKARYDKTYKIPVRIWEIVTIINQVLPWCDSPIEACSWYRSERLPALGGLTSEYLVKSRKASAVLNYLDRIAEGGYT